MIWCHMKDSIKDVLGDLHKVGQIKIQSKGKKVIELCGELNTTSNIEQLNKNEEAETDNFVDFYTNQFDIHFKVS